MTHKHKRKFKGQLFKTQNGNKRTDERTDGRIDGRSDGQTDERTRSVIKSKGIHVYQFHSSQALEARAGRNIREKIDIRRLFPTSASNDVSLPIFFHPARPLFSWFRHLCKVGRCS